MGRGEAATYESRAVSLQNAFPARLFSQPPAAPKKGIRIIRHREQGKGLHSLIVLDARCIHTD